MPRACAGWLAATLGRGEQSMIAALVMAAAAAAAPVELSAAGPNGLLAGLNPQYP